MAEMRADGVDGWNFTSRRQNIISRVAAEQRRVGAEDAHCAASLRLRAFFGTGGAGGTGAAGASL